MKPYAYKPTLLVVEDGEPFRHLVVTAAERTGEYSKVCDAPDGQAALDLIHTTLRVEVAEGALFILTDLSMPRMDGMELIRALKLDPQTHDVPIAVMTSSNRPHDREDATAAGCCAFFYKPQRLDEITTLVGSVPRICGARAKVSTPTR